MYVLHRLCVVFQLPSRVSVGGDWSVVFQKGQVIPGAAQLYVCAIECPEIRKENWYGNHLPFSSGLTCSALLCPFVCTNHKFYFV